jgi:hypothetical protein
MNALMVQIPDAQGLEQGMTRSQTIKLAKKFAEESKEENNTEPITNIRLTNMSPKRFSEIPRSMQKKANQAK